MAVTAIAGVGLAIAGAGAVVNYVGQQKQLSAQKQALAIQQQQEKLREQQMQLEAARRRRELIRKMIANKSLALSAATNQGAASGSALPGAYAGIENQTAYNELALNQNLDIGEKMFGTNVQLLGAYQQEAAGRSVSAFGTGMISLGNAAMTNAGTIGKIGTYMGSKVADIFGPTPAFGTASNNAIA